MVMLATFIILIIYNLVKRYRSGKQQEKSHDVPVVNVPPALPIGPPAHAPISPTNTVQGPHITTSSDESPTETGDQGSKGAKRPDEPQKLPPISDKSIVGAEPSIYQEEKSKPIDEAIVPPPPLPENAIDLVTAQFIGYTPVTSFGQPDPVSYPLTVIPKPGCVVKFPKKGRFSNRGYKEPAFELFLKTYFGKQFDVFTEHHLLVSNGSNPYEPDFSLIDRKSGLNMCIDVEIDEPYSGLSRRPMHCKGDDTLRNAFFSDRGWIVVRFAEIQIHKNPEGCCRYLADLIETMHPIFQVIGIDQAKPVESVDMWSSLQAQKWSAAKYREQYLGIDGFGFNPDLRNKLVPDESAADRKAEEKVITSIKIISLSEQPKHWNVTNQHPRDNRLSFDIDLHQYWIDRNPNTMTVSTLINRMFPDFDEEYWAARKAPQLSMTKEEVLQMWKANGEESRQLGTKLHSDIENHFEHGEIVNSKEFQQFLAFMRDHEGIKPYRTEWRIFDDYHMVAGTADMVVKKSTGGYDLYDWKRSKEIKTDGWGKVGFGPLSHVPDCNYMHYSLQLNFYRWILKAYYDLEIDSMYLVVMHPNFGAYKKIQIQNMEQDIEVLLESTLMKC